MNEKQRIIIDEILLEWSPWVMWEKIKVHSKKEGGIKIPNKKSGVYEAKYVDQETRLTIGKASDLRHRVRQGLVKGKSAHSTGDKIRKEEDVVKIHVRWAETSRPSAVEEDLHLQHKVNYGALPKHVDRT